MPAIKIEGLSKRYLIGHQKRERYTALRDVMMHKLRGIGQRLRHPLSPNRETTEIEEFWALKDIDLEIEQGDRVGIIGRNGAGKSTLLKVLSRITEPTTGRITIEGRIASLLEVGTGFHPELSGRENIYLNGAILGMSRAEIRRKFDEIVEFSGVEKFLDTPVKRYSSGMYVRLAFSVAAHLEPEILIVDEVLAVGDLHFQKKCIGKMEEVGKSGRTILFVSHNMAAIKLLCSRCVFLSHGSVDYVGNVDKGIDVYNRKNDSLCRPHYKRNPESKAEEPASSYIDECYSESETGLGSKSHDFDKDIVIVCDWVLSKNVPYLRFGVEVIDSSGVTIISSMDTDSTDLHGVPRIKGRYLEKVRIPRFLLLPGEYRVNFFAGVPGVERLLDEREVIGFEVIENNTHLSHFLNESRKGFCGLPLHWEVTCF